MLDILVGSTRRRIQGTFYGWWIVSAGFALQVLNGGIFFSGFTIYFVPLKDEFGWSRTLLATGFSVNLMVVATLGPLQGWATDRFGPRLMAMSGVLIFGIGFIVFSQIDSIPGYFFAFFLLAFGSTLCGFLPIIAAITNWFAKKRTLAIGVTMAGMGLGGLLVPILAWSVTTYDWRTAAFASAFAVWLIGIPAALVLRHKPEQYGYLPDGVQVSASSQGERAPQSARVTAAARGIPSDYSFTARQAIKTSAFWMIAAGHAFAVLGVSAVSIHLAPHAVDRVGLSLEAVGGVIAFMMIMSVVGQIAGGFVGDRYNKRALLVTCMLGHAVALIILAYATSLVHLLLFAILHGFSWGARGPSQSALRAEYFGRSSYGTIMGFSFVLVMLGMVAGPIFAGRLADVRGSYTLAFTILAVVTAGGSVSFLFARRPVPR